MPADSDIEAVTAQLSRPPRGSWRVARRCPCGLPQVIETFPRLADGSPFPTLYWLTCRELQRRVGSLESEGKMAEINERLAVDEGLRRTFEISVQRYVERRDSLSPLGRSGHPGGGPGRVKCLHAHTAHHLVTEDNPVGRWVLEQLEWHDPKHPCV